MSKWHYLDFFFLDKMKHIIFFIKNAFKDATDKN